MPKIMGGGRMRKREKKVNAIRFILIFHLILRAADDTQPNEPLDGFHFQACYEMKLKRKRMNGRFS